jgi:hypothetical protein
MVDREEDIKEEMARWRAGWFGIRSTMKSKPMLATFALADPSDKKFHYPAEKRRTKETVEALRQAEANLDAFWEKFDKCLKPGDVKRTALRELLSQNRTLQRTAEWTAPAPTKPSKPAVVSPEDDVIYRPLSTLYFELGASSSTTKLDPIAQPKTKVKTRGTPSQQQQPQQQQQQQQQQQLADAVAALDLDTPQPPAPIPVDARALKVFRTLFFHPAVTSTPGEVAWPDFLHAMAAAGFRAEKLYGSVWHLQPVAPVQPEGGDSGDSSSSSGGGGGGVGGGGVTPLRSIQFHEPHPAAKIPFHVARRMGRRLARAYGWFGGLFVLKEK